MQVKQNIGHFFGKSQFTHAVSEMSSRQWGFSEDHETHLVSVLTCYVGGLPLCSVWNSAVRVQQLKIIPEHWRHTESF